MNAGTTYDVLLLGAGGSSGHVVGRELASRGLSVRLAGRRLEPLVEMAGELAATGVAVDSVVVDVADAAAVRAAAAQVRLVLTTVGPFVRYGVPVLDACLDTRVCYVDIANELAAVRQVLERDARAQARGITARARWAANFGGVTADKTHADVRRTLLTSLVRSSDYSIAGAVRTMRGITTTQAALLPELATTDLVSTMPSLDVPIAIAQGRLDQVAPGEAAQRFYDSVKAPSKQLVWFEKSAHTPQFDEPRNFRRLLLGVKATHHTIA